MANRAEVAGAAAAAAGDREHLQDQNIFLDAARVMLLLGAVAVAAAAVGTPSADPMPMEAFLGLVLWLLGVCLLALVQVQAAGHFPRAALAAADMVITILKHLFALQN